MSARVARAARAAIARAALVFVITISTALVLSGQTTTPPVQPDCQFFATFTTAATNSSSFDNRTVNSRGCFYWTVLYVSNGFSAVSFLFQDAPDSSGTPGSWVTFAGTTISGSNPATATTQSVGQFSGYYPWLRVRLDTATGSGTVQAYVYGYKTDPAVTAAGGGGGSTVVTQGTIPWVVAGTAATGASPSGAPVYTAGLDSASHVRPLATTTSGGIVPDTAATPADAKSNAAAQPNTGTGSTSAPQESFPYYFNGTTWDRARGTTNGAQVQGASATGAAAAGNPVYIGGLDTGGNARPIATTTDGGIVSAASATPADATANTSAQPNTGTGSTNSPQGAFPYVFNGATWDRLRGTTNGAQVQGAAATGASVAGSPVYVGGLDSTGKARPLATNTSGGIVPAISATPADARANSSAQINTDVGGGSLPQEVFPYNYNGSTWDRQYVATNNVVVNLTGAATLELIPASSSKVIRLTHISFTASGATSITFVAGTGTNCGTGTTSLSGVYTNVTAMTLDFTTLSAMRTAASNALCITISAAVTLGGFAAYAQF